jgi:hypothetical protein
MRVATADDLELALQTCTATQRWGTSSSGSNFIAVSSINGYCMAIV